MECYGNSELLKLSCSNIQDGHHGSHLENLQIMSASEQLSLIEFKLDWRYWGVNGNSELLKLFCSNIQDGSHGGNLENLQITSALLNNKSLSLNLMGGIGVLWRFRIARLVLFQYSRWQPWWQSWNSSNNIRFWIAKGNLIWEPRWLPWHNVIYLDQRNPDERYSGPLVPLVCRCDKDEKVHLQNFVSSFAKGDNFCRKV